ncbi:hypothetical protein [Catenuloplanes japonicus]|uniref:hypothetical protein n=1 Tax=Catenuloplanes japonicus TaxID=33876 RepID=UPI0005270875|nr:hypothetical protein [Catenuloplanes japonicus]
MTAENEESPVRHFCAQLDGYVRASGQTRSYVVSRHSMSDSQVYAVLAGTVKTPPSFDRMVVPIIEICGGDATVIAQWRTRHDTMVRVYELQKSLRRKAVAASPSSSEEAPLPEDQEQGQGQGQDRDRFGEVVPLPGTRRRWMLPAVAIVVVLAVLAGGLTWAFVANRSAAPETGPEIAAPDAPESPLVVDPLCTASAPADGGDLLEVPRPEVPSNPIYNAWWANRDHVHLRDFGTHHWAAAIDTGAGVLPYDWLAIRGCLPIIAGHRYTLTFIASASADVTLAVRVQHNQWPYEDSLMEQFAVTSSPQPHTYNFVGGVTSQSSELTFQLGGNPALDVEFTDIVLTDLGA